jgi:hypothetical protein
MKRYSLTSDSFTGEVMFVFNDWSLLESFDTTGAQLSETQQVFLLKSLPRDLAELQNLISKSISAKITEIPFTVTFDLFWNRYNEKLRSSRKKSLAKWIRLSATDQAKAYYFIAKYENSIPNGVSKKYAESYLNAELWNN